MRPTPDKDSNLDPLYVIFEQHLYQFHDADMDRKAFIGKVVMDYLAYLRKLKLSIPNSMVQSIAEEIGAQVNTMLVKKIYGCLSIQDYQKSARKDPATPTLRRQAKARYTRLRSRAG
ncbi:MAG: hypothetical protein AB7P04_13425 [Bacteriovoracia bacterium]